MKLKELFKAFPVQIKGSKEIPIKGLSSNSKHIGPDYLFIAKKGKSDHGGRYVAEAAASGASAVLTEQFDPTFSHLTQVVCADISKIEGALAAHFYGQPSDHLWMVGITGTNGKTTTAFIIKHLLDQLRGPCGLIGTIEYVIGKQRFAATRTTPDVISNYQMLSQMVRQGCRSAVMEVTSHALDQERVAYLDYDVAIFSNLTLDHLDYHQTMDQYCAAKNKLFRDLGCHRRMKKDPAIALVNADSPWLSKIIEGCTAQTLMYSIDSSADLRATQIDLRADGTRATITYQGKECSFHWPLIGRFNVYNCLSAIGVGLIQGLSMEDLVEKMATLPVVRGRLERVPNTLNLKIYVDYAHSDDALLNVLETLSEVKQGRLITVFGCGGDRDKSKRPKMAEAAEHYSDFCIVTSDNPRSEDPQAICDAIVQGFNNKESYTIVLDRRAAIRKAIQLAKPDDIVLIAGKGHETYQVFAHQTIEFDDCKVAAEACRLLSNESYASL